MCCETGFELARLPRTSSLFSYIFTVRVHWRTFVRLTLNITHMATRKLQRRDTVHFVVGR